MSNKKRNASLMSRAICVALRDNEIINKTCNINGPHTEAAWHLGVASRIDDIYVALRSCYSFDGPHFNSRKLLWIRVINPEIEYPCSISAIFSRANNEEKPLSIFGDMHNADDFIHSIIKITTERISSYVKPHTYKYGGR